MLYNAFVLSWIVIVLNLSNAFFFPNTFLTVCFLFLLFFNYEKLVQRLYGDRLALVSHSLGVAIAIVLHALYANPVFYTLKYVVPLGQFINLIAIVSNGYQMPVVKQVTEFRGVRIEAVIQDDDFIHTYAGEKTKLRLFVDRIQHPWITYGSASIGDILIFLGFMIGAIQLLAGKLP